MLPTPTNNKERLLSAIVTRLNGETTPLPTPYTNKEKYLYALAQKVANADYTLPSAVTTEDKIFEALLDAQISSGGGSENPQRPPTVTDDRSQGYRTGSVWSYKEGYFVHIYVLYNDAVGNADWRYKRFSTLGAVNYGDGLKNSVTNGYPLLWINHPVDDTKTISTPENTVRAGNVYYPNAIWTSASKFSTPELITTPNSSDRTYVKSGVNTINFTRTIADQWIRFHYKMSGYTSSVNFSACYLLFEDGATLTFEQSVIQGYVQPLITMSSITSSTSYLFANILNIYTGGTTDTKSYPSALVHIKPIMPLIGTRFTTNREWDTGYDGFQAHAYDPMFDMAIEEF
jgi:hypothetical protein